MQLPNPQRIAAIKAVIAQFLQQRRDDKLEKLPADDPKRSELLQQFIHSSWIDDAAHRVVQIQAVTHSLKPIHPDAKGSSLYREPGSLVAITEVGTHSLGKNYDADVVGNAAALDVYKFLKLSLEDKSLLELALAGDQDFAAALSEDSAKAELLMQAFAGLAAPRGRPSSHSQAKQLYWLADSDAHDDQAFHLLAPLYPTSLVHRVYQQLQDDRFSDEAKAARAARKEGSFHPRPVREYPDLAIQQLGGTKPQNISQLNSERRGNNCLLASLPPMWKSAEVRPLLGVSSMFKVFGRRREVLMQARALRRFLEGKPAANIDTKRKVLDWVNGLIDELLQFSAEQQTLAAGWSQSPDCDLPAAQRLWLDPDAANTALKTDDAADQVAAEFARWLNAQLRDPLPVGDPEFYYWRKLALDQIKQQEREAA
ncbi:type I-F CRISPR-associated protein Csy1 [Roseateles albus]|uniref:Type I-F CRISPR-associated protein Csy1 n=1 Tax=Roseateles albus TaxID=2987525 RepID=A0ABT5KHY6_9BURK|nr:type I-F CRISPR-associated protein Csy1 [Roseateles albus]MDC8773555.1 type I-F CRISPR-associated protein Csy1 [Roseateles albus]